MRHLSNDLRLALVSFLVLIVLMSVGCGQQEALVNPSGVRSPFVSDYWMDTTSNERLELIGVRTYTETAIVFKYPHPSGTGDVQCVVNAVFRGDVKSGTVQVSSPDGFAVTPSNMSSTPCDWMRSITRYGIIGEQLTVSYDLNQKMRVFTWNPAR